MILSELSSLTANRANERLATLARNLIVHSPGLDLNLPLGALIQDVHKRDKPCEIISGAIHTWHQNYIWDIRPPPLCQFQIHINSLALIWTWVISPPLSTDIIYGLSQLLKKRGNYHLTTLGFLLKLLERWSRISTIQWTYYYWLNWQKIEPITAEKEFNTSYFFLL